MIKQGILMIVLCCFAGSWVMAQGGAQRGQVKGVKSEMTEETKAALNLSASQRVELDALQAETAKALESARQGNEDRGASMREIKEADQTKLEEILNEDQLTTLHNIRMESKGDRPEQESRVRERVRSEEGDLERVRPEKGERERVRSEEGDLERVRPEKGERERVRSEEGDLERVRPEKGERERVRSEEGDLERVRPEKGERERVRSEEGDLERVRPEKGERERDRERVRQERGDRRPAMAEGDRERMQEEIRSYNQRNIEPAMNVQRQKLAAAMSAEDQARLTALRSQLASDRELRNAQQNKELVAMVSKYDRQITSLLVELEPRQQQWKADQSAIRAKYMGTSSNDRTQRTVGEETEYRSEGNEELDLEDKIRFLLRNDKERRD